MQYEEDSSTRVPSEDGTTITWEVTVDKGYYYLYFKETTTPVTEITVAPNPATVEVGKTVALQAAVTPTDATNQTLTWSSGNEAVATVDQNGVVTGVAEGTVTIQAISNNEYFEYFGNAIAYVTVNVQPAAPTPETPDISGAAAGNTTETVTNGDGSVSTVVTMGSSTITLTTTDTAGKYLIGSAVPKNVNGVEQTVELACLVLVENGDGTYSRKTVTTETDGTHTVQLAAGEKIVVAIKGDTNGDGELDISDTVAVKAAELGRTTPDNLAKALMDTNGDGILDISDTVAVKAAELGKLAMSW